MFANHFFEKSRACCCLTGSSASRRPSNWHRMSFQWKVVPLSTVTSSAGIELNRSSRHDLLWADSRTTQPSAVSNVIPTASRRKVRFAGNLHRRTGEYSDRCLSAHLVHIVPRCRRRASSPYLPDFRHPYTESVDRSQRTISGYVGGDYLFKSDSFPRQYGHASSEAIPRSTHRR